MGQTGHIVLGFNVFNDIQGLFATPAAGAVSAGDEIGLERRKLCDGFQKIGESLFRLGREELERIGFLSLLKNFFYF